MTKVVFTNGCFDILHPGHLELLERARALGDKLIVGINSDKSVRAVKGNARPINDETSRAAMLMAFESVDEVRIFDEITPELLIKEIKPDVLVKGGDWGENEIVGAEFVKKRGGEVYSIQLKEGYSTSKIIEKIKREDRQDGKELKTSTKEGSETNSFLNLCIKEHIKLFEKLFDDQGENILACAKLLNETLCNGGKVLVCGNGGSAADSQHFAAELIGRYELERKAFPAIALTTDTSALTAISNDYSFDEVFSRQVEGLGKSGDLLIAISTSGNSTNVIRAVMKARELNCKVIGLTAAKGKKLAALCDACVLVPSKTTARIQEAHLTIIHILCESVDKAFSTSGKG
ncbi:MAG: D-sedoheptulose 7-phosphate isomerase [Pyrinomonadaceae bacterium]